MLPFIYYLLKMIACSAIFAGYYWCFLKNGKFHNWNRFYLLLAVIASIALPVVKIPLYVTETIFIPDYFIENVETNVQTVQSTQSKISAVTIIAALYLLVTSVLAIVYISRLLVVTKMKKGSFLKKINNVSIYTTDNGSAPFSFFNSVFWRNDIDMYSIDGQYILRHELAHIHARHNYDKLFIQIACILFWVNPVFLLIKRELSIIHEYAADKASIADSDAKTLAAIILCSLYPNNHLEFTNQFYQSPIKRRLVMLSKNNNVRFSALRKTMILPLIVAVICLFSISIEAKPVFINPEPVPIAQNDTVKINFQEFDTPPEFPGKDPFVTWVHLQSTVPKEAIEKKVQGKFTVTFTIKANGTLDDIRVIDKVDPRFK